MQSPPRHASHDPANPGTPSSSGQRAKDGDRPPGTFFLGRYRVVDEIGVGGMASVHLARMDGPGGFQKWVAIKRIHPHLVEDDQFVDMFLDEARIAAGINHANVAQVFDLGKDENTYWIAMEYLHGEPLREVMRRQEEKRAYITPELASRICSDAAEGLHAAHELRGKNNQLLGLVHRDVTPHNLFVTYDGYTKVVDFGIAKVADRLSSTRAGTLKGKLAYMSPEQVRGSEVDRTTDVFALGVVLWELTTNQRLFRMDTDLDTLEKVQACVVPPPSTIVPDYPIELEAVVMKALAKRKPDRFQSAREFSRALQNFLMRRGAFVGPEEVAAFVRQVFSDRIQKREAHLAWAAEVTSTINVDALRAGQATLPGSAEDLSLVSYGSDDPKRPKSGGVQAPQLPQGIPQSGAFPAVRPAGMPPLPPPPISQAGLPSSGAGSMGMSGPSSQPMVPLGLGSQPLQQMAATSLMDDDEDVPTTVATREQHSEGMPSYHGGPERPIVRPAAGMPAAPMAAYAGADERTNAIHSEGQVDDLGQTIALPSTINRMQQIAEVERARQYQQQQAQAAYGMQQQHPMGPYAPQPFNGYQQQQAVQATQTMPIDAYSATSPVQAFPTQGHGMIQPQSQIETALSLPRPDPAALWMAQQEAASRRPQRRNTGVLVGVVMLTALCVIGIAALVYLKFMKAPAPSPIEADVTEPTAQATPPPPPPAPTAAPSPPPTAAPTETATATPTTAPTPTAAPAPRPVAVPAPAPAPAPVPVAASTSTSSSQAGAQPTSTAASSDSGFITIVCNPFCDDVQVDGRSLGPSPIIRFAAKPGQHRITCKRSGAATKVISVMVVAGQVSPAKVRME